MSSIRSILIPSVLALGVVIAPVARAADPAPASTPAASAPAKATTAPTTAKATTAPSSSTHKSSSAKSTKTHIDLNSASREQLMTLPGVGDATADKIIAARPFKSKEELKSKGIVTKAEYDKLASHVTAKAEPAKK